METVAFCEYDEKCRQVLKKHWPDVPIYNDIRTLSSEQLEKDGITGIGLICGGYPCQPFSLAGKRSGEEDDRHLWPEMFRLIQEIRPAWVIGENVAGHISMGLDRVLSDLESEGYAARPFVIPACAVDAPHRRDRVWVVAYAEDRRYRQGGEAGDLLEAHGGSNRPMLGESGGSGAERKTMADPQGQQDRRIQQPGVQSDIGASGQSVADSDLTRREEFNVATQPIKQGSFAGSVNETGCVWPSESSVGRVANGVPGRVDRLRQLGNSVVPQIPEIIGRAILESSLP